MSNWEVRTSGFAVLVLNWEVRTSGLSSIGKSELDTVYGIGKSKLDIREVKTSGLPVEKALFIKEI